MATAAAPIARYRRPMPQVQQDPNAIQDPSAVPYAGAPAFDPNSAAMSEAAPATAPDGSPIYGNPGAATSPRLNPDTEADIHRMFYEDQQKTQAGADQLNNEDTSQLNYYGNRGAAADTQQDQALQQLKGTPGYTPGEAGQINTDYSKYNTGSDVLGSQYLTPTEQQGSFGDPSVGARVTDQGISNENARLDQYGQNLSGQVGNYANYTKSGLDTLTSGLDKSTTGLASGLDTAQGKFGKLDTAVNNPALAFDPNSTEKQLSDADVQQMKTAAGTRIGNQYQTAEDTLERNAAASGNASPMAVAAANARLQHQEAADQGDAETNADIAARQAQYTRAAGIEGQREGAVNTQTGYKANAATTEEAAAQNAAALSGTTNVGAATTAGEQAIQAGEAVGKTGIDAANQYGTTALTQQNTDTTQQANADTTAEQESAARANQIATNRQGVDTGIINTRYNQGTGSRQLTSQGAQTTGNARIAGEGAYRAGVAGNQQLAQQGGENARAAQGTTYSTQAGALNTSTANRANYENTGPGALGKAGTAILGDVISGASTAASGGAFGTLHADGDIITSPQVGVVGEAGPEMVVPMGDAYNPQAPQRTPYRNPNTDGSAAVNPTGMAGQPMAHGQMVTKPTLAVLGESGPEAVVPMNPSPHNKIGTNIAHQLSLRVPYRRAA